MMMICPSVDFANDLHEAFKKGGGKAAVKVMTPIGKKLEDCTKEDLIELAGLLARTERFYKALVKTTQPRSRKRSNCNRA